MKFEIHITGHSARTIRVLEVLSLKAITIALLDKSCNMMALEYMSSIVTEQETFQDCLEYTMGVINNLKGNGVKIHRTKIECPYKERMLHHAVYIEAHVKPSFHYHLPLSKNVASGKIIGTVREYHRPAFDSFINKWKGEGEIELCILDTNIDGDKNWFRNWDV